MGTARPTVLGMKPSYWYVLMGLIPMAWRFAEEMFDHFFPEAGQ